MDTNDSVNNKENQNLNKLKRTAIILAITVSIGVLLLKVLIASTVVKRLLGEYEPGSGAISVINSPDGSAQIIVREGPLGFSTETRFYYKKVGSSREYKIGRVGLGDSNFGSPFFEGCEYSITWSATDVTIRILTNPARNYWQTLTFTFPD